MYSLFYFLRKTAFISGMNPLWYIIIKLLIMKRSILMTPKEFIAQFTRENLEKHTIIKDDKDVWFYRALGVLLRFEDHAVTLDGIVSFDVDQPLKNVIGGTGSLKITLLNLRISFGVDEDLVRKFFAMIDTDDPTCKTLPDISIREYCDNLVEFLHFHGRKEMKI
ncbi:hypothetical protein B4088_1007 [Bacillus cereus]|uniref:Uncharacterized protein n=2 Tax=Bacillus cereus TaxID=1396 RepID=A0A161T956_BACCE|nr:hypothetical protein B4088_1007 [Bacillus cereus]